MKRMVNRPLLLSALLALLGGGAAFLALRDAGGSRPATGQPVTVVVAARPLAVGQRVEAADVVLKELPAAATSADAARTLAEVDGRYAALPLARGETVLRAKLSERPPGSNLASLIPAGRVAVSVAVSDVVSTGGFIAPGDRVDVLGVTTRDAAAYAEVVLQDIPVLAVASTLIGSGDTGGTTVRSNTRDNPRSLDATVTLAVTVDEARRLVQVDEIGTLRLALRARGDGSALSQRPAGP